MRQPKLKNLRGPKTQNALIENKAVSHLGHALDNLARTLTVAWPRYLICMNTHFGDLRGNDLQNVINKTPECWPQFGVKTVMGQARLMSYRQLDSSSSFTGHIVLDTKHLLCYASFVTNNYRLVDKVSLRYILITMVNERGRNFEDNFLRWFCFMSSIPLSNSCMW